MSIYQFVCVCYVMLCFSMLFYIFQFFVMLDSWVWLCLDVRRAFQVILRSLPHLVVCKPHLVLCDVLHWSRSSHCCVSLCVYVCASALWLLLYVSRCMWDVLFVGFWMCCCCLRWWRFWLDVSCAHAGMAVAECLLAAVLVLWSLVAQSFWSQGIALKHNA